jgi:ubiquinone/menaquinone biosynthesis C-methylase UbiE
VGPLNERKLIMTNQKQAVKSLFSEEVTEWAANYSDLKPRTLLAQIVISRRQFALEMVEASIPQGSKVLDAGCGTGAIAEELIRRGYEVWGFDIAEAMVRYVQDRLGQGRFRVGDIENIPFGDNTFDAVVCLGVLQFLDADEPALREVWRVLKPGGRAVIATPNGIRAFYYMDCMIEGLVAAARPLYRFGKYRLLRRPKPKPQPPKLQPRLRDRFYYRAGWLRQLRSVGLEPEDWVCHGWGWGTLEPFFEEASLCRASDTFARNPALNWLGMHQLVRVRAVK